MRKWNYPVDPEDRALLAAQRVEEERLLMQYPGEAVQVDIRSTLG